MYNPDHVTVETAIIELPMAAEDPKTATGVLQMPQYIRINLDERDGIKVRRLFDAMRSANVSIRSRNGSIDQLKINNFNHVFMYLLDQIDTAPKEQELPKEENTLDAVGKTKGKGK